VLERCIRTPKKLPNIWLTPQDPPALQSRALASPSLERPAELFHGAAGWVNPAKLIAAWLAHPNIRLQTHVHITRLDDARAFASDLLVVACGYQTPELLTDTKSVLQPIRGQVEWGPLAKHNASAPANVLTPPTLTSPTLTSPINGMGHWIESAHLWLAGATFQRDHLALSPSAKDVDLNFEKLAALRPEIAKPDLDRLRNESKSWVGVRAAQKNRLPLVERAQGIQHSSVCVCAGLGSRGLSLAALCAQTLLMQYPEI
jgi:tRNA 5-methylaminomethyl-2-thiouridine biosynthesis bifunctional protein